MQFRFLVLLAIGCGGHAATASHPPRPTGGEPLAPPALRLPRTFVPTGYAARLALAPGEPGFRGRIDIEGTLAAPARVIWLHADELALASASATTAAGPAPLEIVPAVNGFVALRAAGELAAGRVEIAIEYAGRMASEGGQGVFRQQHAGAWYVYTHFEPLAARRVFPCFDEPDVKVPWQLTLDVPAGMIALSNTPAASDTPSADGATRSVVFQRTRPLPSYLIAFAVGGFDLVDAPPTRAGKPVRIITPRGQATAAAGARADIGPLLATLEDYLGSPYPFEKLDLIAIPQFGGAMENPGLITFSQALLLEDPAQPTIVRRRLFANVAAHELAHQWFGNLVTMAWWNDIWLNEAFATWLAAKVVDRWQPAWGGELEMIDVRADAMTTDQLPSARAIRQPIENPGDIVSAFDAITYDKGASILRMFERWVGEDTFRRGVRAYLSERAWGTATAGEFLRAIGDAAGRDVAGPMSTFLDQAGTPIVSFTLSCAAGRPPALALAQQRYRALGPASSAPAAGADRPWQVPVCVRYPAGGAIARDCVLLDGATGTLPLTRATGCPAWLLPNAETAGYYRSALDGDLAARLFAQLGALPAAERFGVIDDAGALVAAGRMPAGDALALVAGLARDGDRHVIGAAITLAATLGGQLEPAQHAAFERYVRAVFGPRARSLGWLGKPSDSEDLRLLRAELVGFVAEAGRDPALVGEAARLTWAWLDDHAAVPTDTADRVLRVTARGNERRLYDRLIAELRKSTDAGERVRYASALAQLTDPRLVSATFDLILDDTLGLLEYARGLFGQLTDDHWRAIYAALKPRFDAIAAKLPRPVVPRLAFLGFSLCDPALRDDVAGFFRARLADIPGGPRAFAEGLERMDSCLARREAARTSVAAALARY